ncbi:Shiga toxin A subunit [Enterobacter cloacae]|uniref:Shiga toxin A subunit n=1 Tax=Enterobacter cloacae complex TaxID=354276 RepID=UPI00210CB8C5|nr:MULTISPECIES: Shiga toxin A subunit [Enterobacter cloacae complex]MCQ4445193.1 Shiga toxin A subunit [Enterobacter cloacae]MDW2869772.1 Shiga toxin A subunit [Enterobacter hormaechei]
MFKKLLICILITVPAISSAKDYGCASIGLSMESSLFDALSKDLKIDTSTVDETNTKVEIIDVSPISKIYAASLARVDFNNDKGKDKTEETYNKIYFSSYYDNEVESITAKYTYTNKAGKKSVFIATSLMNKDECSIRFNGYITLSREF